MTPRRAASPLLHRRVLALLAVLASFAFLSRQPVMGAMSRAVDIHAGMAGHHSSAEAHPTPAVTLQTPGSGGHDHAAHCLFCFTAAFALGADPSVDVHAPPTVVLGPRAVQVDAPAPPGRHADARAPPVA